MAMMTLASTLLGITAAAAAAANEVGGRKEAPLPSGRWKGLLEDHAQRRDDRISQVTI